MILKLNRKALIFLSFTIITFSNSRFLINHNMDDPIAYMGYFLLLCGILYSYITLPSSYRKKYINKNYIIVMVIFSMGILAQSMEAGVKIRLIATMVVIASTALASDGFMRSFQDIRTGAYGLLFGVLCSIILSFVTGTSLSSGVAEGVWSLGFSAGMGHKNNLGMVVLGSFGGIYVFYKYVKKKMVDVWIMGLDIILMIFSHARVAWILLIVFMIMIHFDQVKMICKKERKLFITVGIGIGLVVAVWMYQTIALHSSTYLYRFRGLINWIHFYTSDWFHLVFGNAEMAYKNTGLGYTLNVRTVTGWDGTLEMALLSIMIKNGFIGFLGYIIIFTRFIHVVIKTSEWPQKATLIAFVVVMLTSALTETFAVNIAVSFGTYSYTVMGGICGMSRLNQRTQDSKE